MVFKTWCTPDLLAASGIQLDRQGLAYAAFFDYHSLVSFCLVTFGMVIFVLSLQEGFYAYQLKKLGWALVTMFAIVAAGHGHIVALWRNRLWFTCGVAGICCHNLVEFIISTYGPFKTPLLAIDPHATRAGFILAATSVFSLFWMVSQLPITRRVPTRLCRLLGSLLRPPN